MLKLMGFRENSGSFIPAGQTEEISYSKYDFSLITDEDPRYVGYSTVWRGMNHISIPVNRFTELTGLENPKDLAGKEVIPDFGIRYGKPYLYGIKIAK